MYVYKYTYLYENVFIISFTILLTHTLIFFFEYFVVKNSKTKTYLTYVRRTNYRIYPWSWFCVTYVNLVCSNSSISPQ